MVLRILHFNGHVYIQKTYQREMDMCTFFDMTAHNTTCRNMLKAAVNLLCCGLNLPCIQQFAYFLNRWLEGLWNDQLFSFFPICTTELPDTFLMSYGTNNFLHSLEEYKNQALMVQAWNHPSYSQGWGLHREFNTTLKPCFKIVIKKTKYQPAF